MVNFGHGFSTTKNTAYCNCDGQRKRHRKKKKVKGRRSKNTMTAGKLKGKMEAALNAETSPLVGNYLTEQ